jgi:hypothetical protein
MGLRVPRRTENAFQTALVTMESATGTAGIARPSGRVSSSDLLVGRPTLSCPWSTARTTSIERASQSDWRLPLFGSEVARLALWNATEGAERPALCVPCASSDVTASAHGYVGLDGLLARFPLLSVTFLCPAMRNRYATVLPW